MNQGFKILEKKKEKSNNYPIDGKQIKSKLDINFGE